MCRACPTIDQDQLDVMPQAGEPGVTGRTNTRPTQSDYVVWFDEYQADDRDRVGGKCASLGVMMEAGLPVPPGFAITVDAYDTLRSHHDLVDFVHETLEALDTDSPRWLERASQQIRSRIEAVPLPADVEAEIRAHYAALCEHCGVEEVPVAVRSSATAEDLPDASFAGQQDTYLWVAGADDVVDNVRRCWSSLYTARAMSYRHERGHEHDTLSMSVGIQKMVEPKAAGVAFTLNPSDGDRSQIAIDACWGFGEAVVSGEVTPDNFMVDKVMFEITSRTISPKQVEYRLNSSGVEKVQLDPDDEHVTACCLTDDEIKAVARFAKRAEQHYGRPQDIEWAVDRHLPDGENIVLLQSRPETVWSNKPRRRVSETAKTGVSGIVSTLVSPVHKRGRVATTAEE